MSTTQLPGSNTAVPDVASLTPIPARPPDFAGDASPPPRWSAARRFGFRFACAYFLLYLFPFPLGNLPVPGIPLQWWTTVENALARWTETRIFGLAEPMPIVPTGSGDTMAQWALQVDWLLLAFGIALAWTLLDRRRPHYERGEQWLHVYVRFALAFIMFSYGFAKIIPTQMPPPQLERLVQPWGEFSPMGVLWSFMGVSAVYQIFTGLGEAVGGALLLFRRTTTLGALLLVGVLANVVLLNFTFDVPVKLYSSNLLAMAIFLAAADSRRLLRLFVLNRPVEPRPMRPLFASTRVRRAVAALTVCFVAYVAYNNVTRGVEYYRQAMSPQAPVSPLYGIWDVERLSRNSVEQPPLLSDSTRIRRVVFGGLNRATFRLMSDSVERYTMRVDSAAGQIVLTARFDPNLARTFSYERPDADHLALSGLMGDDTVSLRLVRLDERRFLLLNRGYHWIQEQPFNR